MDYLARGIQTVLVSSILIAGCQREESVLGPTLETKVIIKYRGLIAYVPDTVNNKDAVWALLVDADYGGVKPKKDELPPFADDTHPGEDERLETFPAHFGVLRVKDGDTADANRLIPMAGSDWRVKSQGSANVIWSCSNCATSAKIKHGLKSPYGNLMEYQKLDKVWQPAIDPDVKNIVGRGRLGARFLIDRGSVDTSYTGKNTDYYAFEQYETLCPDSVQQPGKFVPLVQEVTQEFGVAGNSVVFEDKVSGDQVTITKKNQHIEIWIQNETLDGIAFPELGLEESHHLETFRWFYWLSADPNVNVRYHAFPCPKTTGGTRCPQKEMDP